MMRVSRYTIRRVAIATAMALIGAALMIKVDGGGAIWLKFALYSVFFVAVFLAAFFSPLQSCGWSFFRRQTKG